jgi:hypothetical protein
MVTVSNDRLPPSLGFLNCFDASHKNSLLIPTQLLPCQEGSLLTESLCTIEEGFLFTKLNSAINLPTSNFLAWTAREQHSLLLCHLNCTENIIALFF